MADLVNSIQQRLPGLNLNRWLRPMIILGVLLSSAFFGRLASQRMILLILAGLAGLILLRWPMIAIFPLVIGSLVVPFELGTGTNTTINITLILVAVLLALWVLELVVQQRRIFLYPSRVLAPLIGLCVVVVLSFIAGQLPWFAFAQQVSLAAQFGGLILFLLSAGAFLWVSQHIQDIKWLRWLVWSFIGLSAVLAFSRVLNLGFIEQFFIPAATGSMLWIWLISLSASQGLFNTSLKRQVRFLLLLISAIALAAGLRNYGWASGWAPGAVAMLAIIFLRNWRLGIVLSVIATIVLLILRPDLLGSFVTQDQYSIITRQEAWRILINEIVQVSPVLGLGPANYYNYTLLFPIFGYRVRFNSHNQYVDLIAQTGFLGILMFLWLVIELFWLGWRLKNRAASGFERAYVLGAMAGLAGSLAAGMLGDWLIPFVYNIGLRGFRASVFAWLFLGGLLLIERQVKQREALGKETYNERNGEFQP